MTETFRCGDNAALVGYLYDDCEPEEREAIAAHVLGCRICAQELEALAGTREQLSAWTPPDALLGFRITRDRLGMTGGGVVNGPGPAVVTPIDSRWWQRPMPAWGQLAAALLIFASGLAVGNVRGNAVSNVATAPTREGQDATVVELQDAVASLEQRLAGVEQGGQVRTGTRVVPASSSDIVSLPRLRNEVAESEKRQEQEFLDRIIELSRIQADEQRVQRKQLETNSVRLAAVENWVLVSAQQ
jgi:hypothetical protein